MYIKEFQDSLNAVLEIDPSLKTIAEEANFTQFLETHVRPGSFQYIVQSIASQQLSGLAARAIIRKMMAFYDDKFPTPEQILSTEYDTLRGMGLSNQKVKYVQGVAHAYSDGTLSDEILENATTDEIVDHLVSLKGIGAWSAQMFLLFYHRSMDVFSPGDLGIQRGFKQYLKMGGGESIKATTDADVGADDLRPHGTHKKALLKTPLPVECKHMVAVASKFKPHRSAFQLLMWKLSDTVVEIGKRPPSEKTTARERSGPKIKKSRTAPAPVSHARPEEGNEPER